MRLPMNTRLALTTAVALALLVAHARTQDTPLRQNVEVLTTVLRRDRGGSVGPIQRRGYDGACASMAARNSAPRSSALRAPTPFTSSNASMDVGRTRAISRSVASWKMT